MAKMIDMSATAHIPVRYFHTYSASFTLPVLRKPMVTSLYPFSLKKLKLTGASKRSTAPRLTREVLQVAGA